MAAPDSTSVSSLFRSNNASPYPPQPDQVGDSRGGGNGPSNRLPDHRTNTWFGIQVSKLKNQKLAAWRPVLYQKNTLWIFLIVGIVFIPVGVLLIVFYDGTKEKVVDYTDCFTPDKSTNCRDFVQNIDNQKAGLLCKCTVEFSLTSHMENDVFLYYGLTNFYQNHRNYVTSRDDKQLLGRSENLRTPSEECQPHDKAYDEAEGKVLPVAPCGAIANSLFNDTFQLECLVEGGDSVFVPLLRTGIAWESDRKYLFKNPSGSGSLESRFAGTTKPKNWHKYVWELDPDNSENNGFENEDLIVWMRTSAFPSFRKPHRRVDHTHESFKRGLPTGVYVLHVNYSYPVTQFGGTKVIVINRSSMIGSFNLFLGCMYLVAGILALCAALLMFVLHYKYSLAKRIMQSVPGPSPDDLGNSMNHLTHDRSRPINRSSIDDHKQD